MAGHLSAATHACRLPPCDRSFTGIVGNFISSTVSAIVLLPLIATGHKATLCILTAWPKAISPKVWVEEEEVLALKRAVTLLAQ